MSIGDDDLRGGFTELEIEAGIPGLLFSRNRGYLDDCDADSESPTDKFQRDERSEAIKLIAGLSHNHQIQNKLIKKLFHDTLDYMINGYAWKENLPTECVRVAKENNCLEILIKGFLKKAGGYKLTTQNVNEISEFCDEVYRNDSLEIIYDRVSRIQKYIHQKIDGISGDEAHLNLNVKQMRNLLSTARLHLNINDIKYNDASYLTTIFDKSKEASDSEKISPAKIELPMGKKYIKNWRVFHLMPLLNYLGYSNNVRSKIYDIVHLDRSMPLESFMESALDIYCGKTTSSGNWKNWSQIARWVVEFPEDVKFPKS